MGVYTKKTVLDLFLSADLLSDSGSYWFWNPWTDGDTSGCRLMVVLLATAAPAAAMVTQLAQLYNKDVKYASVINVMSVIFCIVTMPVMVMLYEMFY